MLALNALSGASTNTIAYNRPEMDTLVTQMASETDNTRYTELAHRALALYASDFVTVDTFFTPVFAVSAPCIQQWAWRPLNTWLWKYASCEASK